MFCSETAWGTLALRDPQCERGLFFSRPCFCKGRILGLFVEDGLVFGLSGRFRSPWNPLGISVDVRVLEIVGLESRSGLILGESGTSFRR